MSLNCTSTNNVTFKFLLLTKSIPKECEKIFFFYYVFKTKNVSKNNELKQKKIGHFYVKQAEKNRDKNTNSKDLFIYTQNLFTTALIV